ncbi:TPA: autotransporter outer membrane beta-barrel domain-containing protein [Yersinia enterocolitica]|nr:autotransporter outer membrane beta-barrel domain-containing protein [Yersinia enterocolitica]
MQGHTAWVSSLAGNGGEVLGQGSTDSTLTINGTHGEDTTFAGVLLNNGGTLNLVKDGTSRQTLTGVGSTVQNIDVLGGTLAFAQNGTFTTVGDYTTHTGATTTIGVDNATLTVGGAFTQQAGSTLDITVGASPDITADTAVLGGQLVINGFADGPAPVKASATTTTTYNLIHTAHGISGNFDNNPLAPTGLDYLLHDGYLSNNDHDYDMRFGLAWTDGLQRQGTGSFTVNAGTAFDIDTALADQIVPTGGFASGWDGRSLTKAGDGLLVLSALNQYTGSTTVNGGTLRTDIADSLLSSREVTVNGGVLDLNGIDQRVQQLNLNNTGTLAFGKVNGRAVNAAAANAFTTLTVTGDYQGNNGLLSLNTRLGDDSSLSDKLVVEGNTAGTTRVQVNNAGGSGAQTLNGIEVVQVKGQSDGVFTQAGRIVAGAYDYFLGRGTGTQANNWVLNSRLSPLDPVNPDDPVNPVVPIERPEASGYIANLAAANTLFATRLHDRLGETQYIDALTGEQKVTSLWLRNEGGHNRFRDSRDQLGTQSNRYVMQLGGDIAQWTTDQDRFHLGVMGGYGNSKSRTDSRVTGYRSDASVDGYSLGMYGTWQANDADQTGLYVDGWAQYSWFDNSVSGQGLASEHYQSKGVTASVESGYTVKVGENAAKTAAVFIQPQAQVTWMGVKADEHKEANGTQVSGKGDGNIQTRLGVKAFMNGSGAQDKGKDRVFQPFIEANWVHNTQDFGTQMDGVTVSQAGAGNIAELKTGVEGQLNKRVNLWGNVSQQLGDQGYSDTAVMLGVKVNF